MTTKTEKLIESYANGKLVELADDQILPANVYEPPLDETQEGWRDIVEATYKLMLKENWKKVKAKED